MKLRNFFVLGCFLFSILIVNNTIAQNTRVASANIMKKTASAFTADYEVSPRDLSEALSIYFEQNTDSRSRKGQGFRQHRGTVWKTIGTGKVDIYYKVSGRKQQSNILIAVSKGYDNFIDEKNDPQAAKAITGFLNDFKNVLISQAKQEQIKEQEIKIKKIKAKIASYNKDNEKLKKRIASLNKDIDKNNAKIADYSKELKLEEANLKAMKK